jgi:hypothetical protein
MAKRMNKNEPVIAVNNMAGQIIGRTAHELYGLKFPRHWQVSLAIYVQYVESTKHIAVQLHLLLNSGKSDSLYHIQNTSLF